jgi:hypothetical protein
MPIKKKKAKGRPKGKKRNTARRGGGTRGGHR